MRASLIVALLVLVMLASGTAWSANPCSGVPLKYGMDCSGSQTANPTAQVNVQPADACDIPSAIPCQIGE